MKKIKFYSLKNILEKNAQYNMIIGERSNGKTYSVLKFALEKYVKTGERLGIIRRWQDDFQRGRGQSMFSALAETGDILKITNGKWSDTVYKSRKWYFTRIYDDGNIETDIVPFAYSFAISAVDHDKSTSYPDITTILFDEFLTRNTYLPDEFVLFMNVLSTIIRQRNNATIFMLGNTVNKYCPYFNEMGLSHIKEMCAGDIDVYHYGDTELTVAVEYADTPNKGKPSDIYFAFDNPKLNMITSGAWEINVYPHCPIKYNKCDILFTYFIKFNAEIMQCEIVLKDDYYFTFIHRKSGEIKNPETDIVYTPEYIPRANYFRKITKPRTQLEKRISEFYIRDKVFYSDNDVGEIVRNYLMFCNSKE